MESVSKRECFDTESVSKRECFDTFVSVKKGEFLLFFFCPVARIYHLIQAEKKEKVTREKIRKEKLKIFFINFVAFKIQKNYYI
jgi:hypothetical protein